MSTHGYAHHSEPMFALDLAREFVHHFHGDEAVQEQERVCSIILCAAAHVADTAAPGAWAKFDPDGFLHSLPYDDEADALLTRVVLVGFFAFLAFRGTVPPGQAERVVASIRSGTPRTPMLEELCRATMTVLEEVWVPPC